MSGGGAGGARGDVPAAADWEQAMTIRLTLAWPSHKLSPNARSHWGRIAAVKQARMDAGWETLAQARDAKLPPDAPLSVALIFCPPTARKYDLDNLEARMKALIDGVADVLHFNDNQIKRKGSSFGEIVKGGRVEVYLDVVTP